MMLSLRQAEKDPFVQNAVDKRTKKRDKMLSKLWKSMKGPKARYASNALKAAGSLIQNNYKILARK